ncbi:MAG: hypothetical protein ACT4P4_01805 [Betaproteobacteria bacterium]
MARTETVALRTAAGVLLREKQGIERYSTLGPEYIAALNDAAREIAVGIPVFRKESGSLRRISAEEIAKGTFEDGGNLLRMKPDRIYRAVLVRRAEVLAYIASLAKP